MANIMKSFLEFMRLGGDDDYDDEDYFEDEEELASKKSLKRNTSSVTETIKTPNNSYRSKQFDDDLSSGNDIRKERTLRSERTSSGKVIPLKTTSRGMEVSIQKPTSFDDSEDICDMLIKGHPVVVNLEGFDPDDAQRIMDFLCGCIYAMGGKLNQIAKYIFIFSPDGVDVSGDVPFDLNGVPTFSKEF